MRYQFGSNIPQPIRKVLSAPTDLLHILKQGERIDQLAFKYYKDPLLSWIIMYANPQFDNEFEIPVGTTIRIPMPLDRVLNNWLLNNQI